MTTVLAEPQHGIELHVTAVRIMRWRQRVAQLWEEGAHAASCGLAGEADDLFRLGDDLLDLVETVAQVAGLPVDVNPFLAFEIGPDGQTPVLREGKVASCE